MKFLFRVVSAIAFFVVVMVTVIKFVQGCSYKEAVGIAEELFREIAEPFKTCCCDTETVDADA